MKKITNSLLLKPQLLFIKHKSLCLHSVAGSCINSNYALSQCKWFPKNEGKKTYGEDRTKTSSPRCFIKVHSSFKIDVQSQHWWLDHHHVLHNLGSPSLNCADICTYNTCLLKLLNNHIKNVLSELDFYLLHPRVGFLIEACPLFSPEKEIRFLITGETYANQHSKIVKHNWGDDAW